MHLSFDNLLHLQKEKKINYLDEVNHKILKDEQFLYSIIQEKNQLFCNLSVLGMKIQ